MYCFRCGSILARCIIFCSHCGSQIHENAEIGDETNQEFLIRGYFKLGLKYSAIVQFLKKYHAIEMSVRTLKRKLRGLGLKKYDDVSEQLLESVIRREIQGPPAFFGYRRMQQHLRTNFNIKVQRDRIMRTLKAVDPQGTELRRSRRLHRRQYTSPGPDHCWHCDGYDKLKPYGLPIYGAIDGFSRKIIWLKVTKTNNDPSVVATFFVDALKTGKVIPNLLRTDCGTETGVMAAIQCYLNQDSKAHIFSRSVSNQRIENWWSHMRRGYAGWIINYFKDLVAENILLPGNFVHMECVWFVFSKFLQKQLDSIVEQWNTHYIRKSRNHTIGGVPDEMYYMPENFDYEHQGSLLVSEDLDDVLQQKNIYDEAEGAILINMDCQRYFQYVVSCENLPYPPDTWEEAKLVFQSIIEKAVP